MTVDFDHALAAGDVNAIVAGLEPLDEAERRRLATRATAWFRELKANTISVVTTGKWPYPLDSQTLLPAARAIVLGTASLSELRKQGGWAVPDDDIAYRVMADRRPDWLAEWVTFILENRTNSWVTPFKLVRRMVVEGLVPRPETPWYALSMIAGLGRRDHEAYEGLKRDRGLLDDEVWRLFEVEGGGETSLAAHDKYSGELQTWTWTLLQLSREGLLSRDRLLDASLDALRRDFAPFRAGWFSRFHEALQPSKEERASRTESYLALLHSPVPPTVSFAVKALGEAGPLPTGAVEQLSPALGSSASSVVKAGLKLLPISTRSAELAAGYLPHRSVDIQTALLGFIEKCPTAPSVKERLERARSGLSPSLSARVAKLLGAQPAKASVSAVAADLTVGQRPPIDLSVPAPVDNIAELVELLAALLERIDDPHDIERALDGVLRFCERSEDVSRRLGPIARRAGKRLEGRVPVPFSGFSTRSDIAGLIWAWATGEVPRITHHHPSVLGFLSGRVHEVAVRAVRGQSGLLLALPTQRGGVLSAEELDARRRQARESRHRPDPLDEIQAQVRAQSAAEPGRPRFVFKTIGERHISLDLHTEPRIQTEPQPTDVPGLFYAALEGAGNGWAKPFDYAGDLTTELGEQIRWIGTVWPSNREPYYARGAHAVAGNINWWQALWHNKVYLEPLLMPTETVGEMATLLLSLGLAAKEPGERGLATDVAVATIKDGRLDVERTGKTLAQLYNGRLVKGSRLARSLADAGRISAEHAAAVSRLLEVVLSALCGPPPADAHTLLSLLNELQASLGHGMEHPAAKAYLVGIEGTRKAATLARQLLAR